MVIDSKVTGEDINIINFAAKDKKIVILSLKNSKLTAFGFVVNDKF